MPGPRYDQVMTAVDRLMLAHVEEVAGGRTEELRAATGAAYAEVTRLVYAMTDRPERPAEPPDDPKLPKRRPAGG